MSRQAYAFAIILFMATNCSLPQIPFDLFPLLDAVGTFPTHTNDVTKQLSNHAEALHHFVEWPP